MANISIRKEPKARPIAPIAEPRWDPTRIVRDFFGWDPFREMTPFIPQAPGAFLPTFEVKEAKDAYLFKADVPGVKEADLGVILTGNRLTITGKRDAEKQEQTDTYFTYERSYGDFARSFTLPDGVDNDSLQADLKEGVLTISIKKRPDAQSKQIPIQSGVKKS